MRRSPASRGATAAISIAPIVTIFPRPHSYTGDDVAEISAHGSPVLLQAIVAEAMRAGARLANPGEFTFRAYLNGRIDLVQAEAVRDLVDAVTPLQARAAFDQLEGTLTARIRDIDAALFDLGPGSRRRWIFPTRATTSSTPESRPRRRSSLSARDRRAAGGCGAGPPDPRRTPGRARRAARTAANRRVQSARWLRPRDCHRRPGDDARSDHGDRRHRRHPGDARRHRGRPGVAGGRRSKRRDRQSRCRAQRGGPGRRRARSVARR